MSTAEKDAKVAVLNIFAKLQSQEGEGRVPWQPETLDTPQQRNVAAKPFEPSPWERLPPPPRASKSISGGPVSVEGAAGTPTSMWGAHQQRNAQINMRQTVPRYSPSPVPLTAHARHFPAWMSLSLSGVCPRPAPAAGTSSLSQTTIARGSGSRAKRTIRATGRVRDFWREARDQSRGISNLSEASTRGRMGSMRPTMPKGFPGGCLAPSVFHEIFRVGILKRLFTRWAYFKVEKIGGRFNCHELLRNIIARFGTGSTLEAQLA